MDSRSFRFRNTVMSAHFVSQKKFDDDDVDSWIEFFDDLVKDHRRLFVRLHDPEKRPSNNEDKVEEPGS